jgi:alkaline phosphatase
MRVFLAAVDAGYKPANLMDADRAIGETLEFDRAVGVARKWADRLGDTTVLVLADHECSGFSLIGALSLSGGIPALKNLPSDTAALSPSVAPARQNAVGTYDLAGFPSYHILDDGYPATMDIDKNGFFVRGQLNGEGQAVHTATDIPVSAYSSGSRAWMRFVGVQKNTDVFFKLAAAALGGDQPDDDDRDGD